MKNYALALALLFACNETRVRPPDAKQASGFTKGLFYVHDSRARVCFAVKTFSIQGGGSGLVSNNVQSFATVSCSPEVMDLVQKGVSSP